MGSEQNEAVSRQPSAKKPKAKTRRPVRGKDFDAWVSKYSDGSFSPFTTLHFESKAKPGTTCVRVRFVEVPAQLKADG